MEVCFDFGQTFSPTNEMIYEMNHIMNCAVDMKSSKAMILAVLDAILALAQRSLKYPKNLGLQRGLSP